MECGEREPGCEAFYILCQIGRGEGFQIGKETLTLMSERPFP